MVSIGQSLKVKVDKAEVAKVDLERSQESLKSFKEAKEQEDVNVKKFFDDLKDKQACAANDVRKLWEENDRWKRELESRQW